MANAVSLHISTRLVFFLLCGKKIYPQFITVMRKPRVGQHVFTVLIKHYSAPVCLNSFLLPTRMHVPRPQYCPDVFTETCEKHADTDTNHLGECSNVY